MVANQINDHIKDWMKSLGHDDIKVQRSPIMKLTNHFPVIRTDSFSVFIRKNSGRSRQLWSQLNSRGLRYNFYLFFTLATLKTKQNKTNISGRAYPRPLTLHWNYDRWSQCSGIFLNVPMVDRITTILVEDDDCPNDKYPLDYWEFFFYSIRVLVGLYYTAGPMDSKTVTCYPYISVSLSLSLPFSFFSSHKGRPKPPFLPCSLLWSPPLVTFCYLNCYGTLSLTVNGFYHILPYSVKFIFLCTSACFLSPSRPCLICYVLPRMPSNTLFS